MIRRYLFALLIVVATGKGATAFVLTGDKWPQAFLGAPVTITYSYANIFNGELLDPTNQPLSDTVIRDSIQEALSLWASVAPLNFVEVPDSGPPVSDVNYVALPTDPEIRFGDHPIDGFGNVKAHAYYPSSLISGLGGDVHFDTGDRWALVGTLTYPDLLGCAEHEIGHALGLDHSLDSNAVMYPTFHRMDGLGTGFLTADDIAGIQAIYGAGVGSVTPLPEPATISLVLAAILMGGLLARRQRSTKAV
jgi:predicted Zn-dependent protease